MGSSPKPNTCQREWTGETAQIKNGWIPVRIFGRRRLPAFPKHNEPLRYAMVAATLAPPGRRLCQPYFGSLDK